MKKIIVNILFVAACSLFFQNISIAQNSSKSSKFTYVNNDNGKSKVRSIVETETNKSYRFVCRFKKRQTATIERYLYDVLGECDRRVGDVRKVWYRLPDSKIMKKVEITLREGHFAIKSTKGCSKKVRAELKAIANDVKTFL